MDLTFPDRYVSGQVQQDYTVSGPLADQPRPMVNTVTDLKHRTGRAVPDAINAGLAYLNFS